MSDPGIAAASICTEGHFERVTVHGVTTQELASGKVNGTPCPRCGLPRKIIPAPSRQAGGDQEVDG